MAATPPGPGGTDLLRRLRRMRGDVLAEYFDARQTFGDVVHYRAGKYSFYLVSHPHDIQTILRDSYRNFRKGIFNEPLKPLLGQGLLTSEGDFWLRQRRLAQPAFHRRQLQQFAGLMVDAANRVVEKWRPIAASQEPLDVTRDMNALTLQIAGQALFGTQTTALAEELQQAFTVALEHINYHSTHPFALPDWVPTPGNRRYNRAVERLDAAVTHIIRARRESGGSSEDLLGLLMAARDEETGETMTDRQLRDEVITFLLAGHETTANALSWTWYLLARHPEHARRLREELDAVLDGRPPALDDLPRLPFTRMVLEESLRLFPPVVVIPRQANAAAEIGGYAIPADMGVIISQYVVHRHPDFWPDPEQFRPERHTPEQSAARHRFAYLPFGAGPRQCIGNEFALMEGQLALATIAQAYELELVEEQRVGLEVAVTLRPRDGLWMKPRPR